MNRNRIVSALLACLLVTAGVAGPFSSTANAWEMGTEGECDGLDYMVHIASFQQVNSDSCDLRFGDNDDMTTHLDHYQQGETLNSQNDGFVTSYENFGQDTQSVAFSKAKIKIVNGLNDGNTSSVVKSEANTTVRDYYTRQQRELLNQIDRSMRQAEYSDGVNDSFVASSNGHAYVSAEVQLINGSTMWVRVPQATSGGWAYVPFPTSMLTGNYKDTTSSSLPGDNSQITAQFTPNYEPPSTDHDRVPIFNGTRYVDAIGNMQSQSDQVTANIDSYVDGVYSEYQQGELNTTDITDPQTLASQAATDYNGSGYYSYAATHLATLGYAGNMDSSVSVSTVEGTYDGTLFYTGSDQANFTVGESYDPSTMNGSVYMAVQDGENGTIKQLGAFTVEEATNPQTGESMDRVAVEEYTYSSTNTSNLSAELDRLRDLREDYESVESSGGGGSGSGMGSNTMLILLAGAAAAAILIGRNNGGGNGGRR